MTLLLGVRGRRPLIFAALATATIIAIVDVASVQPVLIALLALAPLIAALGVEARVTALIALYALALGVALGPPNEISFDLPHLVRIAVIAGVGLLAIWISALRERLLRSRNQLEAILGGVADGVIAQAPDGRVVFANDAAARVLGYPDAQRLIAAGATGIPWPSVLLDERGREVDPLLLLPRAEAAGRTRVETTVRFRAANGSERWSVVKVAAIFDERDELALTISIVEDITDRKRAERTQQFLADAGRVLSASLEDAATVSAVSGLIVPRLADVCAVDLLDADGSLRNVDLETTDAHRQALARELLTQHELFPGARAARERALSTNEPQFEGHLDDERLRRGARSDRELELWKELDVRSTVVVPMTIGGRPLGVITLVSAGERAQFGLADVDLAEEVGRRAAVALDNARLYSERSYIARALQESLLPPQLPSPPGIEVAARFRPQGAGNEVGGDFYDLFERGEDRWAIAMGDVCGKGAEAAATTALARYTLRAAAMGASRPSGVLETLNHAILRQRGNDQFCTVAFIDMQRVDGRVAAEVASAGHPLPLVLRADGTVEHAGAPGTLLGVVEDPAIEDRPLHLGAGDSVVLYTDGVTEARAPAHVIGEAELAGRLAECSGEGAAEIAHALERLAIGDAGEPRDDIAILVLRLTA